LCLGKELMEAAAGGTLDLVRWQTRALRPDEKPPLEQLKMEPQKYDPEALDQALAELASQAQWARDAFRINQELGLVHFEACIHALSLGIHQISLLTRK
jgi:hypothetical protein